MIGQDFTPKEIIIPILVGFTLVTSLYGEYARFTPHELLVHFPSLKKYLEPRLKVSDSVMNHTYLNHTFRGLLEVTEGK